MVRARARTPAEASAELERRVQSFADKADLPPGSEVTAQPAKDAKRNFKSLNLPLNEYESNVIAELSKKLDRSQSNVIRHAIMEAAKREGIIPE